MWGVKNIQKTYIREFQILVNGKTIWSKCAKCGNKKSRFIKNQEAKGLISNLGLRTPLSKAPLFGDILLWVQIHWVQLHWEYKMNETVKIFISWW